MSLTFTLSHRQRVLRDFDCTPVSYPDIPSMHLHPLWQVWDTALEDFLCQLPIPIPMKGDPYAYRSPILFQELLQSIAGQLSLFANANMEEGPRDSASKLCANSLPVVFSACEGGRYRSCALNLLAVSSVDISLYCKVFSTPLIFVQKYLDIGGLRPVEWILRCGIFDVLPAILNWSSPHEASVAIFLLQRLMLSENGPQTLIQPLETLHKPPIYLLGDFLCQHIRQDSINLPSDTVAGVLYLYTKAILDAKWDPPDALKAQFKQIVDIALDADDSLVRTWASLALAACPPPDVQLRKRVQDMAISDTSQDVRIAASFAVWCWHGSKANPQQGSLPVAEVDCDFANFISLASEDASYLVRTFAFSLAMELAASCQQEMVEQIKHCPTKDVDIKSKDASFRHSPYPPIMVTLVRGYRDPLQFLQKAMHDFLRHAFINQVTCDSASWNRVFPNILRRTNSGEIADQALMENHQTTVSGVTSCSAFPSCTKPAQSRILTGRSVQRDSQRTARTALDAVHSSMEGQAGVLLP